MRPLFTFLFFLLASLHLYAQPALSQSEHRPVVGDEFFRYYFLTDSLTPGPAGASVTWDFSQTNYTGDTDSVYTVPNLNLPPAPGPYDISFPFAQNGNLGTHPPAEDYLTSISDMRLVQSDRLVADYDPWTYSNSKLDLAWPFSYGDSAYDEYAGEHSSFGGPVPFTGNITITADGYGTLYLPNDTIADVLRLHYRDSLWEDFFGSPFLTVSDEYRYYHVHTRYPLLVFKGGTGNAQNFTTSEKLYVKIENPIIHTQISTYPNPFNDIIQLQPYSQSLSGATVLLYGMDGTRRGKWLLTEAGSQSLTTASLPMGIYLMRIELPTGETQTTRLIKTK